MALAIKHMKHILKRFGETFKIALRKFIEKNAEKALKYKKLNEDERNLIEEVVHHANLCNTMSRQFQGRTDIKEKVNIV